MTRFTLTVLPDGHALLTTEEALPWHNYRSIMEVFEQWRESPAGIAVMSQTEVVRVESLELALPDPSDRVRGSESGS